MVDNFITIGITTPTSASSIIEEAAIITEFLTPTVIKYVDQNSSDHYSIRPIDFFHIRKPHVDSQYVKHLVSLIPEEYHKYLILHSHYNLLDDFKFGGIHIKPSDNTWRNINFLSYPKKTFSRSCHEIKELETFRSEQIAYFFLSPIFNSISKKDYFSSFSLADPSLLYLTRKFKIIALGGVKPELFHKLFDAKFVGAALLGYIWSPKITIKEKRDSLIMEKIKIKNLSIL